jgi:hypothetical protein
MDERKADLFQARREISILGDRGNIEACAGPPEKGSFEEHSRDRVSDYQRVFHIADFAPHRPKQPEIAPASAVESAL